MSRASGEEARIDRLHAVYKWPRGGGGVLRGIGDDAAVLAASDRPSVWTVDVQVEGRHFRREWLSFVDLGYRAYMAAASDLAAMGAEPVAALSSWVLPADVSDDDVEALARGTQEAALLVGAPIVGGNLSGGEELSLTTTLIGAAAHPLPRDGGQAGDSLWLAGQVGVAADGLQALMNGDRASPAIDAWRRPHARIADGLRVAAGAGRANACIDVSDGLALDVDRLARASNLGAILDVDAVLSVSSGVLELALHGGEDYALVAASPHALPGFVCIGELVAEAGLWLRSVDAAGATNDAPLTPRGFDHFAK